MHKNKKNNKKGEKKIIVNVFVFVVSTRFI